MRNFESLKILVFNRAEGGKIVENNASGKKNSMLIITKAGACDSSFIDAENRVYRTCGGLDCLRGYVYHWEKNDYNQLENM